MEAGSFVSRESAFHKHVSGQLRQCSDPFQRRFFEAVQGVVDAFEAANAKAGPSAPSSVTHLGSQWDASPQAVSLAMMGVLLGCPGQLLLGHDADEGGEGGGDNASPMSGSGEAAASLRGSFAVDERGSPEEAASCMHGRPRAPRKDSPLLEQSRSPLSEINGTAAQQSGGPQPASFLAFHFTPSVGHFVLPTIWRVRHAKDQAVRLFNDYVASSSYRQNDEEVHSLVHDTLRRAMLSGFIEAALVIIACIAPWEFTRKTMRIIMLSNFVIRCLPSEDIYVIRAAVDAMSAIFAIETRASTVQDVVDEFLKRALEWLSLDTSSERHLCGLLIVQQAVTSHPLHFVQHLDDFMGCICVVMRDNCLRVREIAAVTLEIVVREMRQTSASPVHNVLPSTEIHAMVARARDMLQQHGDALSNHVGALLLQAVVASRFPVPNDVSDSNAPECVAMGASRAAAGSQSSRRPHHPAIEERMNMSIEVGPASPPAGLEGYDDPLLNSGTYGTLKLFNEPIVAGNTSLSGEGSYEAQRCLTQQQIADIVEILLSIKAHVHQKIQLLRLLPLLAQEDPECFVQYGLLNSTFRRMIDLARSTAGVADRGQLLITMSGIAQACGFDKVHDTFFFRDITPIICTALSNRPRCDAALSAVSTFASSAAHSSHPRCHTEFASFVATKCVPLIFAPGQPLTVEMSAAVIKIGRHFPELWTEELQRRIVNLAEDILRPAFAGSSASVAGMSANGRTFSMHQHSLSGIGRGDGSVPAAAPFTPTSAAGGRRIFHPGNSSGNAESHIGGAEGGYGGGSGGSFPHDGRLDGYDNGSFGEGGVGMMPGSSHVHLERGLGTSNSFYPPHSYLHTAPTGGAFTSSAGGSSPFQGGGGGGGAPAVGANTTPGCDFDDSTHAVEMKLVAFLAMSLFRASQWKMMGSFAESIVLQYLVHPEVILRQGAVRMVLPLLLTDCNDDEHSADGVVRHYGEAHCASLAHTVRQLLFVAVSDPSIQVRRHALEALTAEVDDFLHSSTDAFGCLFAALQDEFASNSAIAARILRRIAPRNPAIAQPHIRKLVLQVISQLKFSLAATQLVSDCSQPPAEAPAQFGSVGDRRTDSRQRADTQKSRRVGEKLLCSAGGVGERSAIPMLTSVVSVAATPGGAPGSIIETQGPKPDDGARINQLAMMLNVLQCGANYIHLYFNVIVDLLHMLLITEDVSPMACVMAFNIFAFLSEESTGEEEAARLHAIIPTIMGHIKEKNEYKMLPAIRALQQILQKDSGLSPFDNDDLVPVLHTMLLKESPSKELSVSIMRLLGTMSALDYSAESRGGGGARGGRGGDTGPDVGGQAASRHFDSTRHFLNLPTVRASAPSQPEFGRYSNAGELANGNDGTSSDIISNLAFANLMKEAAIAALRQLIPGTHNLDVLFAGSSAPEVASPTVVTGVKNTRSSQLVQLMRTRRYRQALRHQKLIVTLRELDASSISTVDVTARAHELLKVLINVLISDSQTDVDSLILAMDAFTAIVSDPEVVPLQHTYILPFGEALITLFSRQYGNSWPPVARTAASRGMAVRTPSDPGAATASAASTVITGPAFTKLKENVYHYFGALVEKAIEFPHVLFEDVVHLMIEEWDLEEPSALCKMCDLIVILNRQASEPLRQEQAFFVSHILGALLFYCERDATERNRAAQAQHRHITLRLLMALESFVSNISDAIIIFPALCQLLQQVHAVEVSARACRIIAVLLFRCQADTFVSLIVDSCLGFLTTRMQHRQHENSGGVAKSTPGARVSSPRGASADGDSGGSRHGFFSRFWQRRQKKSSNPSENSESRTSGSIRRTSAASFDSCSPLLESPQSRSPHFTGHSAPGELAFRASTLCHIGFPWERFPEVSWSDAVEFEVVAVLCALAARCHSSFGPFHGHVAHVLAEYFKPSMVVVRFFNSCYRKKSSLVLRGTRKPSTAATDKMRERKPGQPIRIMRAGDAKMLSRGLPRSLAGSSGQLNVSVGDATTHGSGETHDHPEPHQQADGDHIPSPPDDLSVSRGLVSIATPRGSRIALGPGAHSGDPISTLGATTLGNGSSAISGAPGHLGLAWAPSRSASLRGSDLATLRSLWKMHTLNRPGDFRSWFEQLGMHLLRICPARCLHMCQSLAQREYSVLCALFPAALLSCLLHCSDEFLDAFLPEFEALCSSTTSIPVEVLFELSRAAEYIHANAGRFGLVANHISPALVARLATRANNIPLAIQSTEQLILSGDYHRAPELVRLYHEAHLRVDARLVHEIPFIQEASHIDSGTGAYLEGIERFEEALDVHLGPASPQFSQRAAPMFAAPGSSGSTEVWSGVGLSGHLLAALRDPQRILGAMRCYNRLYDFSSVLQMWKTMETISPQMREIPAIAEEAANAAQCLGKWDILESAVASSPRSPTTMMYFAALAIHNGDYVAAEDIFRRLREKLKDNFIVFQTHSQKKKFELNFFLQHMSELEEGMQGIVKSNSAANERVTAIGARMLPYHATIADRMRTIAFRSLLVPVGKQLSNIVDLCSFYVMEGYAPKATSTLAWLQCSYPSSFRLRIERLIKVLQAAHSAESLHSVVHDTARELARLSSTEGDMEQVGAPTRSRTFEQLSQELPASSVLDDGVLKAVEFDRNATRAALLMIELEAKRQLTELSPTLHVGVGRRRTSLDSGRTLNFEANSVEKRIDLTVNLFHVAEAALEADSTNSSVWAQFALLFFDVAMEMRHELQQMAEAAASTLRHEAEVLASSTQQTRQRRHTCAYGEDDKAPESATAMQSAGPMLESIGETPSATLSENVSFAQAPRETSPKHQTATLPTYPHLHSHERWDAAAAAAAAAAASAQPLSPPNLPRATDPPRPVGATVELPSSHHHHHHHNEEEENGLDPELTIKGANFEEEIEELRTRYHGTAQSVARAVVQTLTLGGSLSAVTSGDQGATDATPLIHDHLILKLLHLSGDCNIAVDPSLSPLHWARVGTVLSNAATNRRPSTCLPPTSPPETSTARMDTSFNPDVSIHSVASASATGARHAHHAGARGEEEKDVSRYGPSGAAGTTGAHTSQYGEAEGAVRAQAQPVWLPRNLLISMCQQSLPFLQNNVFHIIAGAEREEAEDFAVRQQRRRDLRSQQRRRDGPMQFDSINVHRQPQPQPQVQQQPHEWELSSASSPQAAPAAEREDLLSRGALSFTRGSVIPARSTSRMSETDLSPLGASTSVLDELASTENMFAIRGMRRRGAPDHASPSPSQSIHHCPRSATGSRLRLPVNEGTSPTPTQVYGQAFFQGEGYVENRNGRRNLDDGARKRVPAVATIPRLAGTSSRTYRVPAGEGAGGFHISRRQGADASHQQKDFVLSHTIFAPIIEASTAAQQSVSAAYSFVDFFTSLLRPDESSEIIFPPSVLALPLAGSKAAFEAMANNTAPTSSVAGAPAASPSATADNSSFTAPTEHIIKVKRHRISACGPSYDVEEHVSILLSTGRIMYFHRYTRLGGDALQSDEDDRTVRTEASHDTPADSTSRHGTPVVPDGPVLHPNVGGIRNVASIGSIDEIGHSLTSPSSANPPFTGRRLTTAATKGRESGKQSPALNNFYSLPPPRSTAAPPPTEGPACTRESSAVLPPSAATLRSRGIAEPLVMFFLNHLPIRGMRMPLIIPIGEQGYLVEATGFLFASSMLPRVPACDDSVVASGGLPPTSQLSQSALHPEASRETTEQQPGPARSIPIAIPGNSNAKGESAGGARLRVIPSASSGELSLPSADDTPSATVAATLFHKAICLNDEKTFTSFADAYEEVCVQSLQSAASRGASAAMQQGSGLTPAGGAHAPSQHTPITLMSGSFTHAQQTHSTSSVDWRDAHTSSYKRGSRRFASQLSEGDGATSISNQPWDRGCHFASIPSFAPHGGGLSDAHVKMLVTIADHRRRVLAEYRFLHADGDFLAHRMKMHAVDATVWLDRRARYTRQLASWSIVQYLIGATERGPQHIFVNAATGNVQHIEFGQCSFLPPSAILTPHHVMGKLSMHSSCADRAQGGTTPSQQSAHFRTHHGEHLRQQGGSAMAKPWITADPTVFRCTPVFTNALPLRTAFGGFSGYCTRFLSRIYHYRRDLSGLLEFSLSSAAITTAGAQCPVGRTRWPPSRSTSMAVPTAAAATNRPPSTTQAAAEPLVELYSEDETACAAYEGPAAAVLARLASIHLVPQLQPASSDPGRFHLSAVIGRMMECLPQHARRFPSFQARLQHFPPKSASAATLAPTESNSVVCSPKTPFPSSATVTVDDACARHVPPSDDGRGFVHPDTSGTATHAPQTVDVSLLSALTPHDCSAVTAVSSSTSGDSYFSTFVSDLMTSSACKIQALARGWLARRQIPNFGALRNTSITSEAFSNTPPQFTPRATSNDGAEDLEDGRCSPLVSRSRHRTSHRDRADTDGSSDVVAAGQWDSHRQWSATDGERAVAPGVNTSAASRASSPSSAAHVGMQQLNASERAAERARTVQQRVHALILAATSEYHHVATINLVPRNVTEARVGGSGGNAGGDHHQMVFAVAHPFDGRGLHIDHSWLLWSPQW